MMDNHCVIDSDFYTKPQENSVNEKPHCPGALVSHECTIQQ